MTAPAPRLVELALHLGQQSALGMDIGQTVKGVCSALPGLVGVTAAVVMLAEQPDLAPAAVFGSDQQADWMGEVQRRAQRGPLPDAIATGRPMTTPDLTRIGPPEVAAAAAECGLTSSVVLPIQAGDQRVGAVQLLGAVGMPVTGEHGDAVRAVVATLAARLVDAYALRRATGRPVGPPARRPAPMPSPMLSSTPPPMPVPKPRPSPTSPPMPVAKPTRSSRTKPGGPVPADEVATAAITAVPAAPSVPSAPSVLPSPRRPLTGSRHAKPTDEPEPAVPAGGRRRRATNGHRIEDARPGSGGGASHAR